MIKQQTVFVLGAGASRPYGYPTAEGLRTGICNCFVGDIINYFQKRAKFKGDVEALEHEATEFTYKFHHSSTKSIDLFLARHTSLMEMGKMAIVFRILAAEKESRFREKMKNCEHDWYSLLFDKMTEGLFKSDDYQHFSENRVSFVTFNYDRSLEHILYESLLYSYQSIDRVRTKEQIDSLDIIHVFGQVAGLPWQDLDSKVKYREHIDAVDVRELAKSLRIIYEQADNPELERAKDLIRKAEKIYFLGFGYRKENIRLLGFPGVYGPGRMVYGSALGLTNNEVENARRALRGHLAEPPGYSHLDNSDCLALLRNYPPV